MIEGIGADAYTTKSQINFAIIILAVVEALLTVNIMKNVILKMRKPLVRLEEHLRRCLIKDRP